MSDAAPRGLTAVHLLQAVLPAEPDASDDSPSAALPQRRGLLEHSLARVDEKLVLNAAWLDRIRLLPPPAAPATLQELVAAARDRLRQDWLRVDVEELDRRRFVLRQVLRELEP
jgi:hypothetical protein